MYSYVREPFPLRAYMMLLSKNCVFTFFLFFKWTSSWHDLRDRSSSSSWWYFIKSFNTQLDNEKDWDENKYCNHNVEEHQWCPFPFQKMFVCIFFSFFLICRVNTNNIGIHSVNTTTLFYFPIHFFQKKFWNCLYYEKLNSHYNRRRFQIILVRLLQLSNLFYYDANCQRNLVAEYACARMAILVVEFQVWGHNIQYTFTYNIKWSVSEDSLIFFEIWAQF